MNKQKGIWIWFASKESPNIFWFKRSKILDKPSLIVINEDISKILSPIVFWSIGKKKEEKILHFPIFDNSKWPKN